MPESLISRVRRLVSGTVNQWVDRLETAAPETVLREAIREVDSATDDVRDRLGLVIANAHHAEKRRKEADLKLQELAKQARFAVSQGRDDLAEAAIARQLDLEAQLPVLEAARSDLASEQRELEGYVAALQARMREMEADLSSYLQQHPASETEAARSGEPPARTGLEAERRTGKAEAAFHRVLEARTGVPGTPSADTASAAKLAELEKLSREHRVKERLAALKASDGDK
ncbi:MAG: PspA/IM30 family protein [Hyphomicrobiaceae bacterium]